MCLLLTFHPQRSYHMNVTRLFICSQAAWGGGGGLLVVGMATLINSNVHSNSAIDGAGLFFIGNGSLINTNVYANQAIDPNDVGSTSRGGGLFVQDTGKANLIGCNIYENKARKDPGMGNGGGLCILGTATLTGTNVYLNEASAFGGGLNIEYEAEATLINSSVYLNEASNGIRFAGGGGGAAKSSGTMTAIDCTFVSTIASTLFLQASSTTRLSNCTFKTSTSTATHDNFIYPNGAHVDYGSCTPGRNPGLSGTNIPVDDGSFTGCPLACPLGTWGRGGPTATLQEMQTSCGVGCETCPEGAVCDATALPAPYNCTVGHYNPDTGSQTAGGCRECERCALRAAACRRPFPS